MRKKQAPKRKRKSAVRVASLRFYRLRRPLRGPSSYAYRTLGKGGGR